VKKSQERSRQDLAKHGWLMEFFTIFMNVTSYLLTWIKHKRS
jgi:hypothetical protein